MNEYGAIRIITERFEKLPRNYIQVGDDVAVFPSKGGKAVLKCDMLFARTDVPPGMTWRQAARKSIAMCVSDFSAKGVRPETFMVSLGLPRGTKEGDVTSLAEGFVDGAREWDLKLIGGDTGEAGDLTIDCVMAGFSRRIVRRDAARRGEYVITTGRFGKTSAGLKILLEGARADEGFKETALESVYSPRPNLRLGLSLAKHLSASIDSSDGLSISLHTIAEMSDVRIRIDTLPCEDGLERFAANNSYGAEGLALFGGEEYEIVGTLPKERLASARRSAKNAGGELVVIGETVRGPPGVQFSDGRAIEKKGWIHLS